MLQSVILQYLDIYNFVQYYKMDVSIDVQSIEAGTGWTAIRHELGWDETQQGEQFKQTSCITPF